MLANEKLHQWRITDKAWTQKALRDILYQAMVKDYPKTKFPNGIPKGIRVSQPDIHHAEKGTSQVKFEKVAQAIYKYLDVPTGYFGEMLSQEIIEALDIINEPGSPYLARERSMERELLEAYRRIADLERERATLIQELANLRQPKE